MTFVSVRPAFAKKQFAPFHQVVNNIADEFLNRNIAHYMGSDSLQSQALVNIIETPEAFHIEVAAPGLRKEDVKIQLEKNQLTVSAQETPATEGAETPKFTRREFNFATFKRTFSLPEQINTDSISAQYDNGVLVIALQKKEIVNLKKEITIS